MILVVGAGPYGCTIAQSLIEAGREVMVIDRRDHVAGNCFDVPRRNYFVSQFGPHIFHTNDREIWEYASRFTEWHPYRHYVKVEGADGRIYSLPFSVQTLYEVYGPHWQDRWQKSKVACDRPTNVEEFCLSQIGRDLYELLVKEYTEKQWQRGCRELPVSIISRLPIRKSWDTCYFNDRYIGMPQNGYTELFQTMLDGAKIETGVDFFEHRRELRDVDHVFYSGPLDLFFNYDLGRLEYRSLRWKCHEASVDQHCPIMNYATTRVAFTRSCQWSHFYGEDGGPVTREYPAEVEETGEPLYPIRDDRNSETAKAYLARVPEGFTFGGRLGTYQYYDMHQVIAQARKHAHRFLGQE